jgi:hypothetical protein
MRGVSLHYLLALTSKLEDLHSLCTTSQAGRKIKQVPPEKWAADNHIIVDPECEADGLEITESSFGDAPEDEGEDENDL